MPLKCGKSQTVINSNVRTLKKDGYKHKRAVAISIAKSNSKNC